MTRIQRSCVSIAAAVLSLALTAPAAAQLVCQKTAPSGKLSFKLREICKTNEIEAQDLSTQPSGLLQQRPGPVCLADLAGVPVAVIPEFQLPPDGEWLIEAKADVVSLLPGGDDYFRCVLTIDGAAADASTARLTTFLVGDLTVLGHAVGGSMVALSCQHDGNLDNSNCPGGGVYVENAKLVGTYLKTFSTTTLP